MNAPMQRHPDKAQELQNNSYTLVGMNDAHIDPMLNACTSAGLMPSITSTSMNPQFMMNPAAAAWNPAMNNSGGFFPPQLPGMEPPTSMTSPRTTTESHSSPGTTFAESAFESSRTSSKSSVPSLNSAATEAKGRRGSNPQRRRASNPAAAPPLSRRHKATKQPIVEEEKAEEEDDDEDDDEEGEDLGPGQSTKRNKFLKRNRIAASKCRQKKKEWVNNLEETRYGLEHQHSSLQMEYNGLVDEVSRMKTQLMQHAACNDPNIDQWIENEARKFVQRAAAQHQAQQHPNQPPCDGINCQHNHHHRRRSSSVMTSAIPRSTSSEFNYDHMPDSMLDPRP
ncbi:hypothetical protein FZEAL_7836 [Fusarium zealandicum]|uniref:BZIP domain-containing protein n=1 Tax=Fusarium zealandicum TaxID=1053134 RepID=A0A8H4UFX4_9HYPO|nr:hypothetical protein FZEAL_7836 [Fusarium zealandicum]